MPTLHLPPDLDLHYVVDDYIEPWRQPATILMLHGNAESSASWYGWVPTLAREYRLVRPDMRGFGASTPMPRDSFHVAASDAERCAQATLDFIQRHAP